MKEIQIQWIQISTKMMYVSWPSEKNSKTNKKEKNTKAKANN